MKRKEVIKILKEHNEWRRGEIEETELTPKEIGIAIDKAIKLLKKDKAKNVTI